MVDNSGQLVGCGRDSFWRAESLLHLAVELAEVVFGVIETMRSQSQCDRCPILHFSGPGIEDLAATHQFFWAESQPRGESRSIAETRNIGTDFHDDGVRSNGTDAGNIGQIHTCDPKQFAFQIKCGFVAGARMRGEFISSLRPSTLLASCMAQSAG